MRGFATLNFYADDVEKAAAWYAELLGAEPYFRVPGRAVARRTPHSGRATISTSLVSSTAPSPPTARRTGRVARS